MDQATLVEADIGTGQRVLEALDRAGLEIAVAVLTLSSDQDDWRLVLASRRLDQEHPLAAHRQVAEALQNEAIYSRPTLLILPMRNPFIRSLRRIFGKTKDVFGMRLGGQTIGNRFLSEGFVYRIR